MKYFSCIVGVALLGVTFSSQAFAACAVGDWGCATAPVTAHTFLSVAHNDTDPAGVLLGATVAGNATLKWVRVDGNTSTTKKWYSSLGNGTISALPVWDTLVDADVPDTITVSNYLLLTGGTLTGKLTTKESAAGASGFVLPPGVAPTSPAAGDFWNTGLTLQYRDNAGTPVTRTLLDTTRAVNTSAPLGGGGALSGDLTVTCATCTTNASALTADQVMLGNGANAAKVLTGGNNGDVVTRSGGVAVWSSPGAPAGHAILSASHSDTLAASVVLGDFMYGNATPAWQRLAGNVTTTNKFMRQLGTGTVSAAPTWDTIVAGDLPAGFVDATTDLAAGLCANGESLLKSAGVWTCAATGAGITSLGASGSPQTGTAQVLATGTSGTDFAVTSAANTHTFNLPSASLTARGLVTAVAQSFAGAKTFQDALAYTPVDNLNLANAAFSITNSAASASNMSVTKAGRAAFGGVLNTGTTKDGMVDVYSKGPVGQLNTALRIIPEWTGTVTDRAEFVQVVQLDNTKLTGNNFLHAFQCEIRHNVTAANGETACYAGFNRTRNGGRAWGGDFHAEVILGDPAASALVGVQAEVQNDNATFVQSSWALHLKSSGTQKIRSYIDIQGAGGADFLMTNENQPASFRSEGIVLIPKDDLNPTFRVYAVTNAAANSNLFQVQKSGMILTKKGIGVNDDTPISTVSIFGDAAFDEPFAATLNLGRRPDGGPSTLSMMASATAGWHINANSTGRLSFVPWDGAWQTGPEFWVTGRMTLGGASNPSYLIQLGADSAAKPSTNTWTVVSDARTKTAALQRPYTKGLSFLASLPPPVYFTYNGTADTPEGEEAIGWIAQDVIVVAPSMVKKQPGKLTPKRRRVPQADGSIRDLPVDQAAWDALPLTDILGINTHELQFAVLNAIQELNTRLTNLERRP